MKKLILLLIASLFALSIYADDIPEANVPANVKGYVTKNYPTAKNAEWEFDRKKNSYEAEFYVDGRKVELEIDATGNLLNAEENILIRDIPASINSYISKNEADAEIMGAKKITRGQSVSYDVRITVIGNNGRTHDQHLLFDASGNLIKKH